MNCKKFDELIDKNLIDDKSMTYLSQDMREHLDSCESCMAKYSRLKSLETSFSELKEIALADDFHDELMRRIEAENKATHSKKVSAPKAEKQTLAKGEAKSNYVSPLIRYKKFGAIAAMFFIFAVSYAVYDYAFKDDYNYMEPVVGDFGMKSEPKMVNKQVNSLDDGSDKRDEAYDNVEEAASELEVEGAIKEEAVKEEPAEEGLEETVKEPEVEVAELPEEKSADKAAYSSDKEQLKLAGSSDVLDEPLSPEKTLELLIEHDMRDGDSVDKDYVYTGEEGDFYLFTYVTSSRGTGASIRVNKYSGDIYVYDDLVGNIYSSE